MITAAVQQQFIKQRQYPSPVLVQYHQVTTFVSVPRTYFVQYVLFQWYSYSYEYTSTTAVYSKDQYRDGRINTSEVPRMTPDRPLSQQRSIILLAARFLCETILVESTAVSTGSVLYKRGDFIPPARCRRVRQVRQVPPWVPSYEYHHHHGILGQEYSY